MTKPEVVFGWQDFSNGKILADKRADTNYNQGDPEDINTELLKLRIFTAIDDWGQE